MWNVEYTDEFEKWWQDLSEDQQEDMIVGVELLRKLGPALPRPYSDTLKGSKHCNMKELRIQSNGKPLRTFYAFDPRRCAILLVGGEKGGDNRFYTKMIPIADRLYDEHLRQIENEGLL